jgi:hypothetical protein
MLKYYSKRTCHCNIFNTLSEMEAMQWTRTMLAAKAIKYSPEKPWDL